MIKGGAKKRAELVCALWLEGKNKNEIAKEVGCSPTSIGHYLRIGGVRRASKIENAMPMIIKMRKEEKSLKEISDATGYNIATISKELNKRGLGYREYDLDLSEPVYDTSNLYYAERKPKVFRVVYEGKSYWDVTELCGI